MHVESVRLKSAQSKKLAKRTSLSKLRPASHSHKHVYFPRAFPFSGERFWGAMLLALPYKRGLAFELRQSFTLRGAKSMLARYAAESPLF